MRKRVSVALFVSLLAMPWVTTGCADECSEAFCESRLSFDFVPSPSAAGDYHLSGAADGQLFDCELTLPVVAGPTCSSPQWSIDAQRPPPNVDEPTFMHGIHLIGSPAHIDINVEHDGVSIGDASLDVTYETIRPNGEGCGPVCYMAKETLLLHP